jgi:hypothetical protein
MKKGHRGTEAQSRKQYERGVCAAMRDVSVALWLGGQPNREAD